MYSFVDFTRLTLQLQTVYTFDDSPQFCFASSYLEHFGDGEGDPQGTTLQLQYYYCYLNTNTHRPKNT